MLESEIGGIVDVVEVGEGGLVLVVVDSVGIGVGDVEVNVVGGAARYASDGSLIAGVGFADDVGDRSVGRVDARVVEGAGEVVLERAGVLRIGGEVEDVVECADVSEVDVAVEELRELVSEGRKIGECERGAAA